MDGCGCCLAEAPGLGWHGQFYILWYIKLTEVLPPQYTSHTTSPERETSHTTSPERERGRERGRESERGRWGGGGGGLRVREREREHACVVIQHIYTTNNNVL